MKEFYHWNSIKRPIMKLVIAFCLLTAAISNSFAQDQLTESVTRGQQVYLSNCISCHMENGEGVEGAFPPLIKTDYVMGDISRLVNIILKGQSGEIKVNGNVYNMDMPAQSHLSDAEIADVANYIRNSWGNKSKKSVSPESVSALRK
jgi:nitrite reductase (NO-forming)